VGKYSLARARFNSRLLATLVGTLAALLIASSCGPAPTDSSLASASIAPKAGGTLRVGLGNIAPALNAIAANAVASGPKSTLQGNLYDTLFRASIANGIEDWLAEKTIVSTDGLTWTMTLRKGVKFHDGTAFDAAAVKTNLDVRRAHPTFALKGQLAPLKEVKVIDATTVQFLLNVPSSSLKAVLANTQFSIESPAAMEKYPDAEYYKHASGTGPFMLDGTPNDQLITLVRNPDYWGPKAFLDKIEFRAPPADEAAGLAALEAGDLDVVFNVPTADIPRIRASSRLTLIPKTALNAYIYFNTTKAPFTNRAARQAVIGGLNSDSYLAVTSGIGSRVYSLVPPSLPGYAKQAPYAYDVTKAKAQLAAAGVAPGAKVLVWSADNQFYPLMAQLVLQDLKALGFDASLRVIGGIDLLAMLQLPAAQSEWQITVYAATVPYADVEAAFFRQLYGPNDTPKGNNWSHWKNDAFDKILVDQQSIADPAARAKALDDLQKLAWDEAPMFAPLSFALYSGSGSGVHDVGMLYGDGLLFGRTWLAK
jgi:peptide/nickel transport system substrate-binding protein